MTNGITEIDSKFYQKCFIKLLPTNNTLKVGNIVHDKANNKMEVSNLGLKVHEINLVPYNLYFLSDENYKEGDWIHHDGMIGRYEGDALVNDTTICHLKRKSLAAKIIASTDRALTTCGNPACINKCIGWEDCDRVPRPSNEFLAAYCKQGGIDEVLVEFYQTPPLNDWSFEYRLKVLPDNTVTTKRVGLDIETQALEILKESLSKYNLSNYNNTANAWDLISLGSGYSQVARDIVSKILSLKS